MPMLPRLLLALTATLSGAASHSSAASVTVAVFDAGDDHKTIAEPAGDPTDSYTSSAFGFFRLPHLYTDTGVLDDRPAVSLVRAEADVAFPAGTHRLLLRSLGKARLTIDDETVAETPPFRGRESGGTDPWRFPRLDLSPTLRLPAAGVVERLATWTTPGGTHRVRFEFLVGAKAGKSSTRPEITETTVSFAPDGRDEFFLLATDPRSQPHTDAGWWNFQRTEEAALTALDTQHRREAWDHVRPYWDMRHREAAEWAAAHPGPVPPEVTVGLPAQSVIDRFLASGFSHEGNADPAVTLYRNEIRPLFAAKCVRCHRGTEPAGGLWLDGPKGPTGETESGLAAVETGDPAGGELLRRVTSPDDAERMPPPQGGEPLTATERATVRRWLAALAAPSDVAPASSVSAAESVSVAEIMTPPLSDLEFLRKVSFDTVGVAPTPDEVRAFLADSADDRRVNTVDRLLADPRHADHWVPYWQEVLAENPNLINPTLNNSGPFRFWIAESLRDGKPFDAFVTELLRMEGGYVAGGPKAFEMASGNDVPMAAKAIVAGSAFLGVNMACARCHDAPFHDVTQRELFEVAALLAEKPLPVPKGSSVNVDALAAGGREPLIKATLKVGTTIAPSWPFEELTGPTPPDRLLPSEPSARDRLAVQITRPENERFAQVAVNRVWARLMGRGLATPVDDWEHAEVTHPELLAWLAGEFVSHGYDLRHVERLILTSDAYARSAALDAAGRPDFSAPRRRRLEPQQIVDGLAAAFDKPLTSERMNLDLDVARNREQSVDLGIARRCWQLGCLTNERDRPSLTLPETQAVIDVLDAFGWRGARVETRTPTEADPDVSQPASLANSVFVQRMIGVSPGSRIERLAATAPDPDALANEVFLLLLTRVPTNAERSAVRELLGPGFESRLVAPLPPPQPPAPPNPPQYVTWSNHMQPEATEVALAAAERVRRAPPVSQVLNPDWRERFEDLLWAVVNLPEFVFSL